MTRLIHRSVVAALGVLSAIAAERPARPNLVVLVSDDQRWDQLSAADRPIIPELRTPHLDALAAQGQRFREAFITTPICAVSRASILTGRYASSHGMNHFRTPLAEPVMAQTYPAVLRRHGYRTAMLGKWGMGTAGARAHFDVFEAWMKQGSYFHETDAGRVHNAEWLAQRAHAFLASHPEDQPFCLTVCFKSPHHPYRPDPRDATALEAVRIPRRANDTAEAYGRLPAHIMDPSLNRWCYHDERGDEAKRESFEKNFLRCVLSLDRAVGQICQSLEDLGLDENTAVFFLSDHGYLWGEHGLGGKWLLYEESIRTPFLVKLPWLPDDRRGLVHDDLVLNLDLAPTLLELAGLEIPAVMDGQSLAPRLERGLELGLEHFFLEHMDVIEVAHPIPDSRGVRTTRWKYIHYPSAEPEVEQLFDLQSDPAENVDLADDPDHQSQLEVLRGVYRDYLDRLGS